MVVLIIFYLLHNKSASLNNGYCADFFQESGVVTNTRGGSRIFPRGGLRAMVMYKLYYIHIAIIHIIILNKVHCNLLKARIYSLLFLQLSNCMASYTS